MPNQARTDRPRRNLVEPGTIPRPAAVPGPPPQYAPPQYWGHPAVRPPSASGPVRRVGPPPQGPGFGWGSAFPPPPRKKSKAGWIILPIVVIGSRGPSGSWMLGSVLKQHQRRRLHPAGADLHGDRTARPRRRPTSRPRPRPRPRPTPTAADAADQDDDDHATATVGLRRRQPKNRIYKTGVQQAVNCRESGARASTASERAQVLQHGAGLPGPGLAAAGRAGRRTRSRSPQPDRVQRDRPSPRAAATRRAPSTARRTRPSTWTLSSDLKCYRRLSGLPQQDPGDGLAAGGDGRHGRARVRSPRPEPDRHPAAVRTNLRYEQR